MAALNTATKAVLIYTHEGAKAVRTTPLQELIRLTMSCMLWEDGFYESGVSVADRIKELVHKVTLAEAAGVAIECRNNMKLRHVPLLIVREMARYPKRTQLSYSKESSNHPNWISETLAEVIQRPDELSEFLAIYWKDGKQPLSKQVKLGLAKAFQKFNEYSLAKYNRKKDIMLRDVLFLCHSKPKDASEDRWTKFEREAAKKAELPIYKMNSGFSEGELLYGKLIYDQLATPDTWEVELSANGNTLASWLRLLDESKLGALAFLRNLRSMLQVGVSTENIAQYGDQLKWGRVLPFRFIAAARMVPQLEPQLESWMFKCLEGASKLPGLTRLFIDVSGSMSGKLSAKSDLTRLDAAKALAMLLREICEDVVVLKFNTSATLVPPRRGFALGDAIGSPAGGTAVGAMYRQVAGGTKRVERDIIITDEQSYDKPDAPNAVNGYFINVASNRNGVGYGAWNHIDGFSEAIVDYIQKYEATL